MHYRNFPAAVCPPSGRCPIDRRHLGQAATALALATLLPRPAPAATSGLVVIGREGWLFPLWDATSHFNAGALHAATPVMNEAVALLKVAGIEVAQAVVPAKARLYREFLPD